MIEIKIQKADKSNIDDAIELSKNSRLTIENGKVVKLGVYKPIYKKNLKYLYVALDESGRVVGATKAKVLDADDYECYEATADERPIMIGKCCVDEKLRGQHIASRLLSKIKEDYKGSTLYVEVLLKPVENTPSLKMLEANGFKLYKQIEWYHKNFHAKLTWGFLKFENK